MSKLVRTLSAASALFVALGLPMATQAADPSVKRCVACHSFELGAKNKMGPNLFGVFARPAGTAEGFKYAKGFVEAQAAIGSWDDAKMDAYLTDPTAYLESVGGGRSKMTFKVKDAGDRAAAIAYMKSLQ